MSALPSPLAARARRCAASLLLFLAWGCGGSLEDRLADVRAQQDAGQFQDSVATLREVLVEQPGHPEASYRLGFALVQTGRPSLAIPHLQQAANTDAFGVDAGQLLASIQLSTRNEEEAIRAASNVLERDPERVAALVVRAQAQLNLNRWDDVLRDAKRLQELEPEGFQGLRLRAQALEKLERLDEAEAEYERAAALFAEGDPTLAMRSCFDLAAFFGEGREDVERAKQQSTRCLEDHGWEPQAVHLAVQLLDELEADDEANAVLRLAIEKHPELVGMRARLGQRLAAAGEDEEARELMVAAARESGDPKGYASWAQLVRPEDPDAALAAVDEGLEQAYGDLEGLRYMRADILVDLERIEEAEQALEDVEEPPLRDHVRGRILLARGEPEQALQVLERSIERFPRNAGARLAAADAALELDDVERAMVELREAHRVEPEGNDACLILARLHYARGEWADAVAFAQRHLRFRGVTGPEAHLIAARAAAEAGNLDGARVTLQELRAREGEASAALGELARLTRRTDGPAPAARLLQEGLAELGATDPARAELVQLAAQLWIEAGEPGRARALASQLGSRQPEAPRAWLAQSAIHLALGDLAAAGAALDTAEKLDPEAPGLATAQGELALLRGDADRAAALVEPLAERAEDAQATYLLARVRLVQGRRDEARDLLRAILRRQPEHAGAANDLAWILAEQGADLDLALALAERAARIRPSAEVLDTLGWVRSRRGDHAGATEAFRRALEQRPELASVRYRLGLALAQQGEDAEAREAFRTALAAGPFPEADAARAALAKLESGAEGAP